MMKLLTSAEMRKLDETTINKIGVPGIVLMENASRGLFEVIDSEMVPLAGKRVLVICGKGNNGGDGFALARHLLAAGAYPDVVLAAKPSEIKGDAKTNLDICRKLKIEIKSLTDPKKLSSLRRKVDAADLVVDALLGTGVKGEVRPFYLKIINAINKAECPVFAVDVPSGISVDDGKVFNGAVDADYTVTFGAGKVGLFVHPAASHAGHVYVVDIGIPKMVEDQAKCDVFYTTRRAMKFLLKDRAETVHKGDCGKLMVAGGSRGMSGAVTLAGTAALRSGAGLVYMAVPKCLVNIIDRKFTEGVIISCEEGKRGRLGMSAVDEIVKEIAKVDAVVVGPGMGVSDATCSIVEAILERSRKPVLVDADGLNCVAKNPDMLKSAKAPVIVTPHPGEMSRLTGKKIKEVEESRLDTARDFAEEYKVVVLLKGNKTLVACPGGEVFVNSTGNAGMATAGSGDVLSGIIGAFLAEGMPVFEAAVAGAFLHGMAGDSAAMEKSMRSVIASDLINFIPESLLDLQEG